jgi:hypothetical protein
MRVQNKILTAETPRAQRRSLFVFPVEPEQAKSLQPLAGHFPAAGLGFNGESVSPDSPYVNPPPRSQRPCGEPALEMSRRNTMPRGVRPLNIPLPFFQISEGGTPGACFRGRGFERFDNGALFEKRMDDVPLNPLPFSVNDSNLPEPFFLTLCEILLQERRNLLGQKGVKINPIFDWNFNNVRWKFGVLHLCQTKFTAHSSRLGGARSRHRVRRGERFLL